MTKGDFHCNVQFMHETSINWRLLFGHRKEICITSVSSLLSLLQYVVWVRYNDRRHCETATVEVSGRGVDI
jgi:hypothetical protein